MDLQQNKDMLIASIMAKIADFYMQSVYFEVFRFSTFLVYYTLFQ